MSEDPKQKYSRLCLLSRGAWFCTDGTVKREEEAELMDGPQPLTRVEAFRLASIFRAVEPTDSVRFTFEDAQDALSDEEATLKDMTVDDEEASSATHIVCAS